LKDKTKAWLAYAAVAFFWGTTFLAIKIAIKSVSPFLLAACRHLFAGTILLIFFLSKGYKLPSLKHLKTFALNGLLMLTLGNGLISWGMQYVDSGLAALISALTPIWIVLINSLGKQKEYAGPLVIMGFILCLVGQVFIFINHGGNLNNTNYLLGLAAVFISNICWALGTVYSKNNQLKINPLFGSSLQMIPGGIMCGVIAFFMGDFNQINIAQEALISLGYLIIFGSILAYGSYMYVLKKLPATIVGTYAYINTVVAIIIGWLWLNEIITIYLFTAVILTIAGVFMINYSMQKK